MTSPPVNTVDFETEAIAPRPDYPPRPVGVAIQEQGREPEYLAWAHPTANNCTKAQAVQRLKALWREAARCGGVPLLFHNAKFDLEVATAHLGLPPLHWSAWHDTMFLAFLHDPYAKQLSLKPLADKHLDMPPEEQEELRAWVFAHVPEAKGKPRTWRGWGAYIARAPGDLVGRYARGDVVRTAGLFNLFWQDVIVDRSMREAYDRERRMAWPLVKSEQHGVPVNHRRLRQVVKHSAEDLDRVDAWLRKRLRAPELDVDSDKELANALEARGFVTDWVLTDKGNRSVSKENIVQVIDDKSFLQVYLHRLKLTNTLRNFARPWLEMADRSGGLITTQWNQVRQQGERERGSKGARTGRLSSSPNFQNVTNKPEPSPLPKALAQLLRPLSYLRELITPFSGHVLLGRDYSQQEFRAVAHFEDGELMLAYLEDPTLDIHTEVQQTVSAALNAYINRKPLKIINFGILYGMGVALLARKTGLDYDATKELRNAVLSSLPGVRELDRALKTAGRNGDPIRTWGGREYHVEPPGVVNGQRRTFEYKLLNYLVQGSSADCTKEAFIRLHNTKHEDTRILLNVHDEILISTPTKLKAQEMRNMRTAMESIEFDVPMLTTGEWSSRNWGSMKTYKE